MIRKLIVAAALATSTAVGLPSMAYAHGWHGDHGWHGGHDDDEDDGYRRHRYYDDGPRYYRSEYRPRYRCRTSGTTGLIIGGAAGALLGREVARDRTAGAILGGGAGALLGREVSRKSRC